MEVMKALYVPKTSELLLSGVPASVSASRVKWVFQATQVYIV